MADAPSQQQIAALLEEARHSVSAVRVGDESQKASAFDLRQSKPISDGGIRGVSQIQEAFARRLTESMSSYLRAPVDVKLASVELASLAAFTKDVPTPTYLASVFLPGVDSSILLYLELPLVFQMVDLMLGGDGKDQPEPRDLTDIEEEIFESAGRILSEELRSAWRSALDTEVRFDGRKKQSQLASLIPMSERLMLTTFDITVGDNPGKMTLALPSAVSTALLHKMRTQPILAEPKNSQKNRARLQALLGNSVFETELMLPPSEVSVREVFGLQPGSIVVLNVRATEPIQLNVAGKKMFLASPVGCGVLRGAQIEKSLSIAPSKDQKS